MRLAPLGVLLATSRALSRPIVVDDFDLEQANTILTLPYKCRLLKSVSGRAARGYMREYLLPKYNSWLGPFFNAFLRRGMHEKRIEHIQLGMAPSRMF
jgi:hypothetical protein